MEIQICSDLHLEFADNRAWLAQNPLVPRAETLIIAGDTYYLDRDYTALDFVRRVSDDFRQVYLIPGNHEYYGGYNAARSLRSWQRQVANNVFMLNNATVDLGGATLVATTLWSEITHRATQVMRNMEDFARVRFKGRSFNADHFNALHYAAFRFLERAVRVPGPKVVVTHHLPSQRCVAPEFAESLLNQAFCIDKTDFVAAAEVDCWVYGHSHRNLPDFTLGPPNTLVTTNQLGYVGWGEHRTFVRDKVVKVG